MVCTSFGSLLRPLFYFLRSILLIHMVHFALVTEPLTHPCYGGSFSLACGSSPEIRTCLRREERMNLADIRIKMYFTHLLAFSCFFSSCFFSSCLLSSSPSATGILRYRRQNLQEKSKYLKSSPIYRVTHHIVLLIPLTSNQKLRFIIRIIY